VDVPGLQELVTAADKAFRQRTGAALTADFALGGRFAFELFLAVRKEYGDDCLSWEPESFWVARDFSLQNRDKLQAAITLATHDTLFTEPRGFAAIALALTGHAPALDDLEALSAHYLAWAALEGGLIFGITHDAEPEWSPDVVEYLAIALFHQGFVVAPDALDFADERLAEYLTDEGRALRKRVQSAWQALPSDGLENHDFPDSGEGVQLARLAATHVYCATRVAALRAVI